MARLHYYESVASTMEIAHEAAADGAEHGETVVAKEQTAARGTRGRVWSSGKGGIWFSVVYRPGSAAEVPGLSVAVGKVLASVLNEHYPDLPKIEIKLTNDLMIQGKKLGGILCEAKWSGEECKWVVIGVGINHHNEIPPELADVATRISDYTLANQIERITAALGRSVLQL